MQFTKTITDKAVFTELAYNNPRDALFALYADAERFDSVRAQILNVQQAQTEYIERLEAGQTEQAQKIAALHLWGAEQDRKIAALQETVAALFEAVNAPVEA